MAMLRGARWIPPMDCDTRTGSAVICKFQLRAGQPSLGSIATIMSEAIIGRLHCLMLAELVGVRLVCLPFCAREPTDPTRIAYSETVPVRLYVSTQLGEIG